MLALLLAGCGSIRPVEKIGLLAPFEGLYRRTGYGALDAMRVVLSTTPGGPVQRLPLALDTSRGPVRSAQKLLADQSVRAVVGPLSLAEAGAAEPVLAEASPLWLAPFAVDANGSFAPVNQPEQWVQPWLGALAQAARQGGYNRLVVAGWPAVWSQLALASDPGHPSFIVLNDDPAAVQPGDAVFHAGDAATVARYLAALRANQPDTPLYLGLQGEDPVLREHSEIIHEVYWMAWLDDGYDAWQAQFGVESPLRYLVHQASMTAIQLANGESPTGGMRIHWYAYDEEGHWRAVPGPGTISTRHNE
jgi:branched-chain amino acid transport system substrate-binding protein